MNNARSLFTDAIEDHLALKKQNAGLNDAMPLEAFDVGDPLDRFPGGPVRPALGMNAEPAAPAEPTALAAASASAMNQAFDEPLQPLNGMTPMLSLVEDVEDPEADLMDDAPTMVGSAAFAAALPVQEQDTHFADVVRFPGGAGPRDSFIDTMDDPAEEQTGEHPVIVIDAEEPLANDSMPMMPLEPRSFDDGRVKRPSFFGLRRKRKDSEDAGDGWLANSPREFNWDD